MQEHGTVGNEYEDALSAITAGSDMDMESRNYKNSLAKLVADKKVPVSLINDAARRIPAEKT